MAQETTFIYGLFDPRNYQLRYIGKSNNPQSRLRNHISESKEKRNHLHYWINRLLLEGLEPSIEILEEVIIDDWVDAEIAWITDCRKFGVNLTNIARGGNIPPSRLGSHLTESHKEKIRQSAISRPRTDEERRKLSQSKKGKSTWIKGKHLSEEHKMKIGKANSGRKQSKEAIIKRIKKIEGRVHTEEHKQKISNGLKRAYLEKRRLTLPGRHLSEEHKQKISNALKGRTVSEEIRKKIGEANKKQWTPEKRKLFSENNPAKRNSIERQKDG